MIQERLGVLVAMCAARKCLKQRMSAIRRVICYERDHRNLGQFKGG